MKTLLITIEVLSFAILISPSLWEQDNDKLGDNNKGFDVVIRLLLMLASGLVNYLFRDLAFIHLHSFLQLLKGMIKPVIQSGAMFFLTFDYWIAYRLGHRIPLNDGWGWLEYLGKTKITASKVILKYNWFDNLYLWRRIGWQGRLLVKVAVFAAACFIYFS